MMLVRLIVVAALTMAGVPASAAQSDQTITPEQDLRCAVVVLLVGGSMQAGQENMGVAAGFSYFIGRWEAATGRKFEEGVTPEYVTQTAQHLTEYNQECGNRMKVLGQRMTAWGKTLQETTAAGK